METIKGKSTIYVENGLFSSVSNIYKRHFEGKKAFIVTDSNVAPLYLEILRKSLGFEGIDASALVITAGEASKTLETVSCIYTHMAQAGITRADTIIALGGGVVGDLSGFAAATYMRGIGQMQIPTTLLAQVDSSIGGKCGVDLPAGKNLVGAFYQPVAVLTDSKMLKSLTRRDFCDGMAEVIKYGAILDRKILDTCRCVEDNMEDVICRCIKLKCGIVERDERDTGERMCLNFGHTFGHAIEKCGGYSAYTHGQGVSMGMIMAARLGEHMGITKRGTANELKGILEQWELPVEMPCDVKKIEEFIAYDKKKMGKSINIILLRELGKYETLRLATEELEQLMDEVFGEG